MSFASFTNPRARRRAILASAAVAALSAAVALTGADVARAAAISTADLQGPSLPSLSPLVDRVKPNDGSKSEQSEGLPSEFQQFVNRFGEQNGASQDTIVGEGFGFFISSDGYIVTNNDVVQNAKSVAVKPFSRKGAASTA
jgi:serine protease Do